MGGRLTWEELPEAERIAWRIVLAQLRIEEQAMRNAGCTREPLDDFIDDFLGFDEIWPEAWNE